MGYPVLFEKRAAAVLGAFSAAGVEAALSPPTALLARISTVAAGAGAPRLLALGLALALILALAVLACGYARPLSRKAAFASGFCLVAVLALFAP